MKSPSYLCPLRYQLSNQLAEFYEIQHGSHAIEGDPDAIIFNLVASNVLK
jgi:hypothetical protein